MDSNKILELKQFLSEGTYVPNADKASKRNIRRLAVSFSIIDGKCPITKYGTPLFVNVIELFLKSSKS